MSGESVNQGCVRCGRPVATDELRVGVSFAPADIAKLAIDTTDPRMRDRLLCALGTVDRDLERTTREYLNSSLAACPSCLTLVDHLADAEQKLAAAHADNEELQARICDLEDGAE